MGTQQTPNGSLLKVILVLGKARSCRVPNLDCRNAESPGWFDVLPKNLCIRCDSRASTLSWWCCQSPVARSCGLLNHLNNFYGRMFKLNTKFGADSLLYSLSHFECDGYTVNILTQGHPPPPTDKYSGVVIVHTWALQSTVLSCQVTTMIRKPFSLLLTMAGLFPFRPHIIMFIFSSV